jgi:hypothetical protein
MKRTFTSMHMRKSKTIYRKIEPLRARLGRPAANLGRRRPKIASGKGADAPAVIARLPMLDVDACGVFYPEPDRWMTATKVLRSLPPTRGSAV